MAALERLWVLVSQWRGNAAYCREPPAREEIALLWDRVANELRAALPDSGDAPRAPGMREAEQLCRIYFDIAAAALGEDEVRRQRDTLISRAALGSAPGAPEKDVQRENNLKDRINSLERELWTYSRTEPSEDAVIAAFYALYGRKGGRPTDARDGPELVAVFKGLVAAYVVDFGAALGSAPPQEPPDCEAAHGPAVNGCCPRCGGPVHVLGFESCDCGREQIEQLGALSWGIADAFRASLEQVADAALDFVIAESAVGESGPQYDALVKAVRDLGVARGSAPRGTLK